jgi:hypothetical protein
MNMQINASAFKAAPVPKTIEQIDSDVCDLRKRAEVLMNLIDAFEEKSNSCRRRVRSIP